MPRANTANTSSRQTKKGRVSAAQFSPNSSGGGDARSSNGSQNMSRRQEQLADKAAACAMEATVSEQNERIAQLEQ